MKGTKLIIMALGAIFIFMLVMCESKSSDISDSTDDDNAQDDDDNNNNNNDIIDDNSQFEDDDNGDDEDETDTFLDGCDGVDFLFVIDNSRSMGDEQQNLINSFPGFVDAITEAIDVDSYHIMAVDSDARYGVSQQDCNSVLGAGHIGNNLGANCGIAGGNRYVTKDQPDPYQAFACIADVGVDGNGLERVMEAMVNAVSRENQPGGCNADFIREKSLLVVTFITDESGVCDEMNSECSEGDPTTWKQALVDAKQGHEEAIVVLGLFGDNDQPDKICTEYDDQGNGAVAAPVLREFLESFAEDHRHYCSVCLPDYAPCFLEAVSIIDMACEDVE